MKSVYPRILQILSLNLFLLFALSPAHAQEKAQQATTQAPARPWFSVTVVDVKPDMVTDYEEFVKKEVMPTLQKGGTKQRDAWQTGIFGPSYQYVYVTPIASFAQYDGDSPAVKALGQEGAKAYMTKARHFATSSRTIAIMLRPDLSDNRKLTGPPKIAVVNWVSVAPGRTQEYESYLRDQYLPVIKQAKIAGFWVNQTIFGGDGNEYVTLTLMDKFADLDKGPPSIQVLGQEGAAKLSQKLAGVVTHVERAIVRYNPELSIIPTASAAQNK